MKFELDRGIVVVSVGVVLAEDIKRFLVPFFGNEPTWGLGDEEDKGEPDDGWKGLGEGRGSPGPVSGDSLGGGQPRGD